jgi:cysteine-rich repeat protein
VAVGHTATVTVTVDANANTISRGFAGGGACSPGSPGCPTLVDTGLDVNVGDSIDIAATGTWRISGSDPFTDANGQTGRACLTGPDWPISSLLGQIGSAPLQVGDPGMVESTFFVGTSFSQTAALSGRLFLAYCDTDYGNNAGSVVAVVTVTPPPAICGNQIVETGEQCDDGNTVSGDGCSDTCQTEIPLPKTLLDCQEAIGSATKTLFSRVFAAQQNCLHRQLRGTLTLDRTCRAFPTGDHKTDNAISRAKNALGKNLQSACDGVILGAIGFPGSCLDPDGPPLTLDNLQQCLEEGVFTQVEDLLNLSFPIP